MKILIGMFFEYISTDILYTTEFISCAISGVLLLLILYRESIYEYVLHIAKILRHPFLLQQHKIKKDLHKTATTVHNRALDFKSLSDQELKDMTSEFKARLKGGATLDDIMVDAFATVIETADRILKERPYLVQIMGGIALHRGYISEMRTGEGKTLSSTMPTYLNALSGKGVHVVTVNDYLAQRDSQWMGQVFTFLGLSVGCILNHLSSEERQIQYNCDITYATNNEIGFDYLRDHMALNQSNLCMRGLNYAIVDEADSIMIDEARTPLIISGQGEEPSQVYHWINQIITKFQPDHVVVDKKTKSVTLTERGIAFLEQQFQEEGLVTPAESIYTDAYSEILHHIDQSLKAHYAFIKEIDYIVHSNEVLLIDEHTGRTMPGRRYSSGLHQALEAKENIKIKAESRTLASINFQTLFNLYSKISGMTGTAASEVEEFLKVYGLKVASIPTNRTPQCIHEADEIYKTMHDKTQAIIREVQAAHKTNQPVLVGTSTISQSQIFSSAFKLANIPHETLNAKQHMREAEIIANAGKPKKVTIVTNMAGRGTDIQLGGNAKLYCKKIDEESIDEETKTTKKQAIVEEIQRNKQLILEAGGLYVIGTERQTQRVDNQLKGRAGRQGDKGKTKFFLSFEDHLMQMFPQQQQIYNAGLIDLESLDSRQMWTSIITENQKRIEAFYFDQRQSMKKYADVHEIQMKEVYKFRDEILQSSDVLGKFNTVLEDALHTAFINSENQHNKLSSKLLKENLDKHFLYTPNEKQHNKNSLQNALQSLKTQTQEAYSLENTEEIRTIMLRNLDQLWQTHNEKLQDLRRRITLQSYANIDPLSEHKKIAYKLFLQMRDSYNLLVSRQIIEKSITILQINKKSVAAV